MNIDDAMAIAVTWMDDIDGVVGVGQGLDDKQRDAVVVYVTNPEVAKRLPSDIEGITVVTDVSGELASQTD